MDRMISKSDIRKNKIKTWIKPIIILIISGFIIFQIVGFLRFSVNVSDIRVGIVDMGSLEVTAAGLGLVIPAQEEVITTPSSGKLLKVLHLSGESVQKGSSLLQIDNDELLAKVKTIEDLILLKKNQSNRAELDLKINKAEINSQLKIKEMELQIAQLKLEQQTQLFKKNIITRSEFNQAELEFTKATSAVEVQLTKVEQSKEIFTIERETNQLELTMLNRQLEEAKKLVDLSLIKAQLTGTVIWVNQQVGSMLSAGEVVARVADLNKFKIEADISDIFLKYIIQGQSVYILAGKDSLTGKISSLSPTVTQNYFKVQIELDIPNHPSLVRNSRVAVQIITQLIPSTQRLPNGPFFRSQGKQSVWVVSENELIIKTVELGIGNSKWIEVKSGLSVGEKVVISSYDSFSGQNVIKLTQ